MAINNNWNYGQIKRNSLATFDFIIKMQLCAVRGQQVSGKKACHTQVKIAGSIDLGQDKSKAIPLGT